MFGLKLLMFNSETGNVLTTSASKEGRVYKGYLDDGYVPVAYVEYFKHISQVEVV
jgi:hypothetical protein